MAITQLSPLDGLRSEVRISQSRKWLMERFAYLPQVRLVFGEELTQFPGATRILWTCKALLPRPVNDD
jgi:hypothetical protein